MWRGRLDCLSTTRPSDAKLGPTELPLGALCAVDDLAVRHRNGRGLYLGDQPSKRNRYNCAQYRKSYPDSKGLAPHRITDTQELWVAPLNHNGSIGNFLVKLYMGGPPNSRSAHCGMRGHLLGPHRRSLRARAVTRVGAVFDRLTIDPHRRVLAERGSYANLTDRHGKRFAGATSLDAQSAARYIERNGLRGESAWFTPQRRIARWRTSPLVGGRVMERVVVPSGIKYFR